MEAKKVILSVLLLWIGLKAQAQALITSTGGNVSSSGGSVSFSVGQIVYKTNTSSIGSAAPGVQQPYEISILQGIEDNSINLNLNVYPNPTSNFLILNAGNTEFSTLNFELYDISGKLIESRKMISNSEAIAMENLPVDTYFLKIKNINNESKIFKIIKN